MASRKNKIATIPNLLSLIRILMIPAIVWLYCVKERYTATLVLVFASWLTDVADGYIARRFDMVSDFGKIFDPIADKLTQAVVLACLVLRFELMLIPLATLAAKEIVAAITGYIRIRKSKSVHCAEWHGKLATFMLYTLIGIHIIWANIPENVSCALIGATTLMMLISAVLYTIHNIVSIRSKV